MLSRPTAPTRRLEPSWRPWTPEPYQLRGSTHLQASGAAVLWLDPGMRKTSIVLHAFCALKAAGTARKMLVVAPKRVCELVWRQEAAKWGEFRHLTFRLLHGPKKAKLLAEEADVYLINPEGVAWLAKQYANRPDLWPFDTVTFDELTKFKNSQAERSKALRGRSVQGRALPNLLKRTQRRWGATGTPSPNGYMDVFGQFLMLDDGAALGRFITHYRDQYFSVGRNGFDYDLQPGAGKRIQARLQPYVFALDSSDYLTLPEVMDDIIEIELDAEARAAYETMRKDLVTRLPEGTLEAANKAVAYSKLSQMAGGAVYMEDGSVQELHTAKLDALSDLIDELGGEQMLIGYEFTHEKDRLKARFGNRMVFLSDARTSAAAEDIQRQWNAGQIQFLACHPASAGHGLNLQEGNAWHMCWFGPIWDLELWDQFIRRLKRSGNTASRIMRHILLVRNSIDELKLQAVAEKDTSQTRLKHALATVLSGEETNFRSQDMVMKLQRAGAAASAATTNTEERRVPSGWGKPQGEAAAAQPEAAQAAVNEQGSQEVEQRKAPSGWGKPGGGAPSATQEQRAEIAGKLNPETAADPEANAGFSAEVIALRGQVEGGEAAEEAPFEGGQERAAAEAAEPTTRSRATKPRGDDALLQELRHELSAIRAEMALLHANHGVEPATQSDEEKAADAERDTTYMFASLLGSAKAAAETVVTLSAINEDAAHEAYVLLFGALEKRMAAHGFVADAA